MHGPHSSLPSRSPPRTCKQIGSSREAKLRPGGLFNKNPKFHLDCRGSTWLQSPSRSGGARRGRERTPRGRAPLRCPALLCGRRGPPPTAAEAAAPALPLPAVPSRRLAPLGLPAKSVIRNRLAGGRGWTRAPQRRGAGESRFCGKRASSHQGIPGLSQAVACDVHHAVRTPSARH